MRLLIVTGVVAACAGSPNTVEVTLSPSLISSLDGTTEISAIVAADSTPLADVAVSATVTYTDRNGTAHDVMAPAGKTDQRGAFHATLTGLTWEGTGTVTLAAGKITGDATFAVLDRTPPKITILPPTTDSKVGPGLPVDIQVHVTDEIGVSEVTLDGGLLGGAQTTVIASGSQDATVTFRMFVPVNATAGPNIHLHALASDLSGNLAAAAEVVLTVDPAISIATPPGLMGSLLTDGSALQLANPRGIAFSSHDGHLYVADQANADPCSPSCVWRVDAATGAIDAAPVFVGTGEVEEVAFDATTDNMYISDRSNRVVRLTWNGSTAYATPTVCDDTSQQKPQDPYHLLFDATLGILVVDGNQKQVMQLATCATTTVGTNFAMNPNFDTPRGIAAGAAGEFYVSDAGREVIYKMTNTGALTTFETRINQPYGMEWLAGGASQFKDSLLVASTADRTIESTTGKGPLAATYLRNSPIDLTLASGTLYIVTTPSATNRGRIFKVTGF